MAWKFRPLVRPGAPPFSEETSNIILLTQRMSQFDTLWCEMSDFCSEGLQIL